MCFFMFYRELCCNSVSICIALQECPTSGRLWAEAIFMESRAQRKSKSVDALKKCDNDPMVTCAVARLFAEERKLDKARTWFGRAAKINPDIGDSWAWLYRFECQHGTEEQQQHVINQCISAEPKHGVVWPSIAKEPANHGKSVEAILKLVSAALEGSQ